MHVHQASLSWARKYLLYAILGAAGTAAIIIYLLFDVAYIGRNDKLQLWTQVQLCVQTSQVDFALGSIATTLAFHVQDLVT